MLLALHLARDFVPGFQYREVKRRPKRNLSEELLLIVLVYVLIGERNCSVSEAVNILVTVPRFAKQWGGNNKRTLENTYHQAVRSPRIKRFGADFVKDHHENSSTNIRDGNVSSCLRNTRQPDFV